MSSTLIKKSEQPTAQSVKEKNPIVSVVSPYTKLLKEHGYWLGLCPFHEESDPSFCAYEDSQRYFCFGCSAKGDVITFVRAMTGATFGEALEILDGNSWGHGVTIAVAKLPEPPKRVSEKLELQYQKIFDSSSKWEGYKYSAESIGGFSFEAWKNLGAAWSDSRKCWVLPFRNAACEIIGFQYRFPDGDKYTLKKTHLGLFIPRVPVQKIMWVAEGASDTATLLTLGLYAIGKPSVKCCNDMVVEFAHAHNIERIIICVDNDAKENPRTKKMERIGLEYSEKLSAKIGIENSLLRLPEEFKDVRAFIRSGKTRAELEKLIV